MSWLRTQGLLCCLASASCTATTGAYLGEQMDDESDASVMIDAAQDASLAADTTVTGADATFNSAADASVADSEIKQPTTASDAALPADASTDANPWCTETFLDSDMLLLPVCCAEPWRCPILPPSHKPGLVGP